MIEKEELLKAFDSRDTADRDRMRILLVVLLDIRDFLRPVIEGKELDKPINLPAGEIK